MTTQDRIAASTKAAPLGRQILAQTQVELLLTLRRGESVLITLIVPVLLLIFFASLNIVPATNGHAINFLLPGMLALAVMATGMVSLGIATAYERYYGVLKRLGGSPLPRSGLIIAKVISVLALELIQTVILVGVAAVFYGWRPTGTPLLALPVMVLGTVTFAALGLAMAGALRAEVTLAGANGLYLIFLLLGGGILPLEHSALARGRAHRGAARGDDRRGRVSRLRPAGACRLGGGHPAGGYKNFPVGVMVHRIRSG